MPPAVYRNRMVWQDNDWDIWDIATTDLWLKTTASDKMLPVTDLVLVRTFSFFCYKFGIVIIIINKTSN